MVIGVDLDSTLADLMPELIRFHNKHYNTHYTLDDYFDLIGLLSGRLRLMKC